MSGPPLFVWVNGAVVKEDEARLSPFDHGLLTGDGVFETLRVYGGRPFAWSRHHARLCRSAEGLGLPVPALPELVGAAEAVLEANGLEEARLRITITGGVQSLGSDRAEIHPTVLVAATGLGAWSPVTRVVTVEWPRNERGALAGLKTISYAENVRALAVAAAAGCTEAVFPNTAGDLCEGTGTNVFVVEGRHVRTPPAEAGCLLGVSRALVLELCPTLGLEAHETRLPMSALTTADEVFLTSTTREVQAVGAVDGHDLPGAPGPVTAALAQAFSELVLKDIDP